MKTKNAKGSGRLLFPGMITAFLAVMLFFSCKKAADEQLPEKTNMAAAAKVLDGTVLAGNVTAEANQSEMALHCNNGNKWIIIEKLPGAEPAGMNSIQSAEVITSNYGVIVKDLSSNKIWLLANNDAESLKRFEAVKTLLGDNVQSTTVFGVTVVNAEKV